MKVCALIPTYNRRAQVFRAIDSVLAQTVPVDEVIVVDDGSTDGTPDAIRSRYGSQIVLLQQKNAGVSAARNLGIRQARCEWIAMLDSDDIWFPRKNERQKEVLASLGGEFGVCFTDNTFGGNPHMRRSLFQEVGFQSTPGFGPLGDPAECILAGREPFFTSSVLARGSLLHEVGGFDEALVVREDTDVLFRLGFKTRFCFTAEPLAEVDRTPTRTDGLCDLFARRDDRVFNSLKGMYTKWLALPEVAGTEYENRIRNLLRLVCYDSTESKVHERRLGPALQEVAHLRRIGDSYPSIVATLLSRKVAKLRRRPVTSVQTDEPKQVGTGLSHL